MSTEKYGTMEEILKSANAGDLTGMRQAAEEYFYGHLTEKNDEKAFVWSEKAAAAGSVQCLTICGILTLEGRGTQQNQDKGLRMLKEASSKGDMKAPRYLGHTARKSGKTAEALAWYLLAAGRGDISSQYCLGEMYEKGEGVDKDMGEAIRWYTVSAERGDVIAKPAMDALERIKNGYTEETKAEVIDANVYWVPQELFHDPKIRDQFIRCVPREYGVAAFCSKIDNGDVEIRIEKPIGSENLNYFDSDYVLKKQLADMDTGGIDRAVMKLPGCQEWLTLELCRFFNDAAAEYAASSNGRLIPLAVVPPYGDEEVLKELDRCVNELHMPGVQMSAHYGTRYLDDPMFRPLLAHINELGIPVYVHHTPLPVDYSQLLDYNNLRRSFGRCQDQITAIGRELFSGMFSELPNLKMIHSMLGGGYFTFKEMLMPRDSGGGRFQTAGLDNVRKWLKNNIFFEMSHSQPWGKENLETAVKLLGADHIIYGSSYPVKEVWMKEGAEFVRELEVSEEDKELMLGGNARRIYGI